MLELTFYNQTKDSRYGEAFFKKITKAALAVFGLENYRVGLSISLLDEERMRRLNKQHRRKDKVTDVLSFPLQEDPLKKLAGAKNSNIIDIFGSFEESERAPFSSLPNIMELGDIFICPPQIKKRAENNKENFEHQLRFLAIHSLLHLFGFDHQNLSQDKEMFEWTKKILAKL